MTWLKEGHWEKGDKGIQELGKTPNQREARPFISEDPEDWKLYRLEDTKCVGEECSGTSPILLPWHRPTGTLYET